MCTSSIYISTTS